MSLIIIEPRSYQKRFIYYLEGGEIFQLLGSKL